MRKRIFNIENDADNAEMMRLMLTLAGYEVSISLSPDEAVAAVKRGGIDLILMEMNLKGRSGAALCEEIRAFNEDIPIVFFSTSVYAADIQAGLKAGANAYLTKPQDLDGIEETIAQLVGAQKMSV